MDFLSKYGYAPDQEAISRALDLIASNLENVASEQVYKDCFSIPQNKYEIKTLVII